MSRNDLLRVVCTSALVLVLGATACGSRLDLGGGQLPIGAGGGGSTGDVVPAPSAGGGSSGVPVGAGDAGNAPNAVATLGQHCSVDADCDSPQVCAQGRCHATCSPTIGCQQGHRLLPCLTQFAAVPVCPLPCDPAWGQDSQFCTHAGEPGDGPPGLYQCPAFQFGQAAGCSSAGGPTCSMTCSDANDNTLRQDCDRGVCNCTYNGNLACRCVTTDPPTTCSFCCNL